MGTGTAPMDAPSGRAPRPVVPIVLIALGCVLLVANVLPDPLRGGLSLAGLGLAFLVARVVTGRYGFAVPAGILLALGAYAIADPTGMVSGRAGLRQSGGWFFLLLGLGFVAVYVIGWRPRAVWPLFPAFVLIVVGLTFFGLALATGVQPLTWVVGYWPLLLVLVGAWLLLRDRVPSAVQRPIAAIGVLAILAYALLVAVSIVDTDSQQTMPPGRRLSAFQSGLTPLDDALRLSAPIAAGGTLRVDNPNGRTTIRGGAGPDVQVVAHRHAGGPGRPPDVRLEPDGAGLALTATDAAGFGWFGFGGSWVDYEVDVPAGTPLAVRAGSGEVSVADVTGAVDVQAGSGRVSLSNDGGPATVRTGSGSVQLTNLGGEVRVATGSGSVRGTGLAHVRDVRTGSGSIDLEGVFAEDAGLRTASGSIRVRAAPGSSAQVEATSTSGEVRVPSAVIGAGAGRLTLESSSGSIRVDT
jgi:Putative adhesin